MKSAIRQLPSSFAKVFGFFIVTLMLVDGSCRLNRAKAVSDEDLQYPCPPGAARCMGLTASDWEFWLYFCFDIPPSCRTNGEPTSSTLAPAHQSKVPQKPMPRQFMMRGR